jgi:hypothetical protein
LVYVYTPLYRELLPITIVDERDRLTALIQLSSITTVVFVEEVAGDREI